MLYRELKPSGAAARFVKCFWVLEDATPSSGIQRILPDGRCELIFNFAEPFEVSGADGWKRQPRAFVVGQITAPMMIRARGAVKTVGIRFRPHGPTLLGMSGQELTERQVALELITKALATRLEQLRDTPQRLEALADAVNEFATDSNFDRPIAYAAAELERSLGAIPVSELARRLGLSQRQFERRFKATVGISPKLFCRIQRFNSVLRAMQSPGANWVNTAIDCGFYDQAHLIRDFQQFAGAAPTEMCDREIHLARQFAS